MALSGLLLFTRPHCRRLSPTAEISNQGYCGWRVPTMARMQHFHRLPWKRIPCSPYEPRPEEFLLLAVIVISATVTQRPSLAFGTSRTYINERPFRQCSGDHSRCFEGTSPSHQVVRPRQRGFLSFTFFNIIERKLDCL
jgi:hypothetical protein